MKEQGPWLHLVPRLALWHTPPRVEVGLRAEREQPWEKWSPLPQIEQEDLAWTVHFRRYNWISSSPQLRARLPALSCGKKCPKIATQTLWSRDVLIGLSLDKQTSRQPYGGKRSKQPCSKPQKLTATCRWSQCEFFSCKRGWEHWLVCPRKRWTSQEDHFRWGTSSPATENQIQQTHRVL